MSQAGQPEVLEKAQPRSTSPIEVHSIDLVPAAERHGRLIDQWTLWFSGNFNPVTVSIGFIGPSLGLSVAWTVVASVVGICAGTLFMAFHAQQGPRLGVPQMIQSRAQYGVRGSTLTLAIGLITYILFAIVNLIFIRDGLSGLYGWNSVAVGITVCVLVAVVAIFGYDWIHAAMRVIFWLSLPLWLVITVGIMAGAVTGHGGNGGGVTLVGFAIIFSATAGYNIVYAPMVSDYSRYLPRDTSGWKVMTVTFAAAAVSALWLIWIGAWLAARTGATDALVSVRASGNDILAGFGSFFAVFAAATVLGGSIVCAYSSQLISITAIDTFRRIRSSSAIRIWAVAGVTLAAGIPGVFLFESATSAVENTLLVLTYLLTPWTTINLVDYYLLRRGRYVIADLYDRRGQYGSWNWRGITSYLAAVGASVPFWNLTSYQGPAATALGGVDISFAVCLVVSGVLYYLLTRFRPARQLTVALAARPAGSG
jgi:NCS1 family nucleobase:cation symporter-1